MNPPDMVIGVDFGMTQTGEPWTDPRHHVYKLTSPKELPIVQLRGPLQNLFSTGPPMSMRSPTRSLPVLPMIYSLDSSNPGGLVATFMIST